MAEVFAAPARYAQGPGVAATLGDEMTRLGRGGRCGKAPFGPHDRRGGGREGDRHGPRGGRRA